MRISNYVSRRDLAYTRSKVRLSNFNSKCAFRIKIQNTHFAVVWNSLRMLSVNLQLFLMTPLALAYYRQKLMSEFFYYYTFQFDRTRSALKHLYSLSHHCLPGIPCSCLLYGYVNEWVSEWVSECVCVCVCVCVCSLAKGVNRGYFVVSLQATGHTQ